MQYLVNAIAKLGIIATVVLFGCGGSVGNETFQTGYYAATTEMSPAEEESPERCVELAQYLKQGTIYVGSEIDSKGISYLNFSRVFRGSHGESLVRLATVSSDADQVSFDEPNSGPFTEATEDNVTICDIDRHRTTLFPDSGNLIVESELEFSCNNAQGRFSCGVLETGTFFPEQWM